MADTKSPLEGIWVHTQKETSEHVFIGKNLIEISNGIFEYFSKVAYGEAYYNFTRTHRYYEEENKWKIEGPSGHKEYFSFINDFLILESRSLYAKYTLELKKVDDEVRFKTIKNLLENEWKFETEAEYKAKIDAESEERQRTPFTGIWRLMDYEPDKFETFYNRDVCIQIKNGEYFIRGNFIFTENAIKEQYVSFYSKEHKQWLGASFEDDNKSEKYKIENDILKIAKRKYQKVNDIERFNKIKEALEKDKWNLDEDWEGKE